MVRTPEHPSNRCSVGSWGKPRGQGVGDSNARSIATKIDVIRFGNADGTGAPPKGLGALADAAVSLVAAPAAWTDIDPFIEAQLKVDAAGGTVTAFVVNPADAEVPVKLKCETGSNEPLLTRTAQRVAASAVLNFHTSAAVPVGAVYRYDQSRFFSILRQDVSVELDRSAYFSSDSAGIRAVARVVFGYAHPKTIARIKLTPGK